MNSANCLPDGIRDRHAHHHLLECKFSEAVNEAALQQALSYDYFYRQTQRIKAAELQTYVVGAQTPRVALLNRFGYHGTDLPGVYVSSQPMLEKVVMFGDQRTSQRAAERITAFVRKSSAGAKTDNRECHAEATG
jgi:hypothetical protein